MHQTLVETYHDLLDPELAHTSLADFTVWRTLNYLIRVFKADQIRLIVHDDGGDLWVTPSEFGASFKGGYLLAAQVAVTFRGGPPGVREWYEGSLLSFMIDRLFLAVARGDLETVETFLRSVAR